MPGKITGMFTRAGAIGEQGGHMQIAFLSEEWWPPAPAGHVTPAWSQVEYETLIFRPIVDLLTLNAPAPHQTTPQTTFYAVTWHGCKLNLPPVK
ncbi:hypothetical protein JOB18_039068 [Solea senegalensis]|uniref:Uncharacterized protein n=1 Tax=Solea senegalensis TaxID=28829 RepID=A0AAV6QYR7_SOLSE|nr:hypothetical protein JOB18_039068 [Solea senegalensis]